MWSFRFIIIIWYYCCIIYIILYYIILLYFIMDWTWVLQFMYYIVVEQDMIHRILIRVFKLANFDIFCSDCQTCTSTNLQPIHKTSIKTCCFGFWMDTNILYGRATANSTCRYVQSLYLYMNNTKPRRFSTLESKSEQMRQRSES